MKGQSKAPKDYTMTGQARIRFSKFKKIPPEIIKTVSENKVKLRKKTV
ncbi:hypothetical protein ABIE66_002644 [Peribacillus sp. B2I2]